jgi:hypothetical protein
MSGFTAYTVGNWKPKVVVPVDPTLVVNLDAANYSAVPVNGSTIAGSGGYAITVANPTPRISWSSSNGGVFSVTTAVTNTSNFFTFGPDYTSASQAYTVGMAYKWNGLMGGRLLNANTSTPDFLMGLYAASCVMNVVFGGSAFIGPSNTAADTNWHFLWLTCTGTVSASRAKTYIATNTQPTGTYATGANLTGFNGLRLFGRYVNATTISESVDANVGFVKVWNKELSLSEIQTEYATYKTRFGY